MNLVTTCPACRKPLRFPATAVGKRIGCPTCKHAFEAPAPSPPPPPAPAAAIQPVVVAAPPTMTPSAVPPPLPVLTPAEEDPIPEVHPVSAPIPGLTGGFTPPARLPRPQPAQAPVALVLLALAPLAVLILALVWQLIGGWPGWLGVGVAALWGLLGVATGFLCWFGLRDGRLPRWVVRAAPLGFTGVGVAGLVMAALLGSAEPPQPQVAEQPQRQVPEQPQPQVPEQPQPQAPEKGKPDKGAKVEAGGWIVHAPDRRWRVELPAQPRALKQRLSKYDTDLLIYALEDKNSGSSFFVSHYDIPSRDLPSQNPADRFRNACDGALAKIPRGRLEKSAPCDVDGHPGMEFVIGNDKEQGVLRTYLVRRRFFVLMVGGRGAPPESDAAQRFLKSFALVTPPPPAPPAPATDFPNLLGYWKFNEGKGERAADSSGHGNSGRLAQPAGWEKGVSGAALKLPMPELGRPSGHVDLGRSPRFNFAAGAPFTYSLWLRTDHDEGTVLDQTGNQGADRGIVLTLEKGQFLARVGPDNLPGLEVPRLRSPAVDDDNWHHVALVRRGDGRLLLYLDGKAHQPEQPVAAAGPLTSTWRMLGARVEFGRPGEHGFSGLLDEVSIFGRDLTEQEIGQLAGKLPRQRKGDGPAPSEPRAVPPIYTLGPAEKERFRGDVAISPDGKLLVAAGMGESARFYDLTTGKPRHDLPEFTGKGPLVFSPDGQYLAGRDVKVLSQVRVLHVPTKILVSWDRPKDRRPVQSGSAHSFSFTPDSKYLALAGRPPQLVEVASGAGQPLTPPDMLPDYLHLGWDGRTMLLAGAEGFRGPTYQCGLVDLASGEARKTMTVEVGSGKPLDGTLPVQDTPPTLRATEDLKYLAVRHRDRKTVQVWSLAEGRKLTSPPEPGKGFQWVAFAWAPDNRTLVLSSTQGLITFWDAAAGKEVGKLRVEGEGEGPSALACSGDGRLLAAGGEAAQVRVWNVEELLGRPFAVPKRPAPPTVATLPEPKLPRRPLTLKELSRFEVADKPFPSVSRVAISPDGRYLFTTHSLRAALWELPEGKPLITLNKVDVGGATFSSDSRTIYWLISRKVERIELPGLKREEVLRDIVPHDAPSLSTDDKVLLIGGPGGVLLHDLATRQERRARSEGGRMQSNPVFDPADGRVAAVGHQYVALMHTTSERYHMIPVTLPGRSFNPRLALRAGRLAIALPLQGAWIRDQKNGLIIGRLPPRDAPPSDANHDVARPVLSPDGERLFLPSHEELTVWHLKTGEVFEARYPFGRVVGAAISADGRTLALLLEDRRVAVMQVTTEGG
ncbi:MAG: hypothetical protein L0Z62_21420 [Gemmataceae bacterium]|nr:hypothetical protein [Gemmataceae bacterium]